MKVKELIKELEQCSQDIEVILPKDAEGNGFNNLYNVEEAYFGEDDVVYLWPGHRLD